MPVSGVTTGDLITEAWGDSVAAAITSLEGSGTYHPGGTDVAVADGGTGASTAAAARTNLGLGSGDAPTFAGMTLSAGIAFPAAQASSSGVNVFDDYEEGTFTPSLALATPGTSSWSVTTAVGYYTKQGNRCHFSAFYQATLTKGTGSGNVVIGGFPFASESSLASGPRFSALMQGWTKAGYSMLMAFMSVGVATGLIRLGGSGQSLVVMTAADLADGTVILEIAGQYQTAT